MALDVYRESDWETCSITGRAIMDIVTSHPQFTPHTIDLLASIEGKDESRCIYSTSLPSSLISSLPPSPLFPLPPPPLLSLSSPSFTPLPCPQHCLSMWSLLHTISPLPVATFYQLCQWLSSQEVSAVYSHLFYHLSLLEAAARHNVSPEVSCYAVVLSLCASYILQWVGLGT